MKQRVVIFLVLVNLLAGSLPGWAKPLKKLKVTVSANGVERMNTIASLELAGYDVPENFSLSVKEEDGTPAICQLHRDNGILTAHWRVDGMMSPNDIRRFIIEPVRINPGADSPVMGIEPDQQGNYILTDKGKKVLRYNIARPDLTHGIDPVFKRNGYIHPAWTPDGYVLTNVNPVDHIHHYGIWNPWTSVAYDGEKYDLWNIGDKTGTVYFDSLYTKTTGNLFTAIKVRHRHVIYQLQPEEVINTVHSIVRITPKKEIIIMDELQDLCVWNTAGNSFLWDFVSTLTPSTILPVIFKAYRYAGFAWRGNADWTKENCTMITSEGKTRPEIDGTNARWIYATGTSGGVKAGILFMASPDNRKFPEPLRIWDEHANGGRGDAFINFAPSKNEDWILEPGKAYTLRYRIVMFDGEISPDRAEAYWMDFANPVSVNIVK